MTSTIVKVEESRYSNMINIVLKNKDEYVCFVPHSEIKTFLNKEISFEIGEYIIDRVKREVMINVKEIINL